MRNVQRFLLKLKIQTETALFIGGPGRTLPLVDRSIEVDEFGFPYIPASSFRGRVRAHLERLLKTLGEPVCTPPRPESMCPHNEEVISSGQAVCRVCRIFGNAWIPSSVVFSNFKLSELPNKSFAGTLGKALWLRPGVGIDRYLGTAEEQKLFTLECVPSQLDRQILAFQGVIEGWLSKEDLGWLIGAIRIVSHLGGHKARGLGQITVTLEDLMFWDEQKKTWNSSPWQKILEEALQNVR